jgi:hypothetical protein
VPESNLSRELKRGPSSLHRLVTSSYLAVHTASIVSLRAIHKTTCLRHSLAFGTARLVLVRAGERMFTRLPSVFLYRREQSVMRVRGESEIIDCLLNIFRTGEAVQIAVHAGRCG